MKADFTVHTFGCKVNTYDTGLLQQQLAASGYVASEREPQIHILNSCAVTQEAAREAAREARRIKRRQPDATVVLTGCAAQVDGRLLDDAPGIDLVVANSHKSELPDLLTKFFNGELKERIYRANIFRHEKLGEGGGEELSHTRSFLKIQDGCNSFCTFCIIPYARGKSRSLPVPLLREKIIGLEAQGVKEVVLTGVHVGDYLDEETPGGPYNLAGLVRDLLRTTKISRLRLTSLEPIELTEELLQLYSDRRMCPHFHMSIQSANSEILHKMKRHYDADKVAWALREIDRRVPDAFVGMDVIVGFPGESERHFADTFQRLADLPWTRIHVFPYSEREGTRAPLLPEPVAPAARKERAHQLRQLSSERFDLIAAGQVGRVKEVLLLEDHSLPMARGLSRDYWDIVIDKGSLPPRAANYEVKVKVQGYQREQQSPLKGFLTGALI